MIMNTTLLYPRYVEKSLQVALGDTPVICLLGPRQSGKTTLVKQIDKKRTYISFDDTTLLDIARSDPAGFVHSLHGNVTLDEIQKVPELLPNIKLSVDMDRTPGLFLLTGSANLLLLPGVQESLAGRMETLTLFPLSEMEKHRTKKSLLEMLLSNTITPEISHSEPVIEGVAEAVCTGGYPEPALRSPSRSSQWHRQYVNAIIQRDVKDIANIRDTDEMQKLMEMLACRTATLLNISELSNEVGLRRETVEKYIGILQRLFLVRILPAWHRNKSKRLIKAPKIHLVDSGLACSLNNLRVDDWTDFSKDFGPLLETFVVQQLVCQSGWVDPELVFSHYRDKDKMEVDLVIEKGKKVWGVEVKKSATIRRDDHRGLARLAMQAGANFQGGIVLYNGTNILPLAEKNSYAVPLNRLWM
jgi:uncharacterized protein